MLQAKRMGTLSVGELEYLQELEQYIDEWEAEPPPHATQDIWKELDELASRVLGLHAKLTR